MIGSHRPLRDRAKILSADVADAIEQLIGERPSFDQLPLALDKEAIAERLVEIAHTDASGVVTRPTMIARRTMGDEFRYRLTHTAVFQAGYKRFEEKAQLPVVPVTDFFFRIVTMDGLDTMQEVEIRQSLPKRRAPARDEETRDYHRDEDGEVLLFGEIAGIVVFPPNARDRLLAAWLSRRVNVTSGSVLKTTNALEFATPAAGDRLRTLVSPTIPALKRALPKPRTAR